MKKQYPPIVWKLCSIAMYVIGGFSVLMAIACFAATIFLSIPFILFAIFCFACAKNFAHESKIAKSKKAISNPPVQEHGLVHDLPESSTCSKITAKARPIQTVKDLASIRSYAVLDTETTGLSRRNDRIVEISLSLYENGVQTDHYATLVNPQIPIPPAASRVNHITDTDVATAPTFAQIWPDVCRMMQDVLIVGHNVTFDLDMIGYAIPDSAASLDVQYLDTLTLSKKAFPGRSTYKLANLVKDLGISSTQTHRADDDVVLTAQLFERCRFEIMDAYRKELEARRAAREQARAEKAARFGWSPMLNKNFVFTGDFQQNREKLESSLEKIGANLRDNVNGNTDYLVKGSLTNLPDWAVERKYSKAVTLSQNGKKVKIIDESEYISLLQQVLQMAPTHQ